MSPKVSWASILFVISVAASAAAAAPAESVPSVVAVQAARASSSLPPVPGDPAKSAAAATAPAEPSGTADAPTAVSAEAVKVFADAPPADPDWTIYPRVSLIYETGPGLGFNEGFTSFQGMIPLYQRSERSLLFADLRGLLSDDTLLGANAGAGYRIYSPKLNRIFGVNAYYDNRETGQTTFNQVSAGFETLGCCWDFRANGYLPVGTERVQVGDALVNQQVQTTTTTNLSMDCSHPFFAGHDLFIEDITAVTTTQTLKADHVRNFEAAMKGFDMEVGAPVCRVVNLWAYAGTYCFQADGSPQAWGARGRLETRYFDNVVLDLSVQNDRVFNTTVTFQGGFTWGGLCHRRHCCCTASDRLGDRVERNYDIVVANQTTHEAVSTVLSSNTVTTTTPTAAIDPATGLVLLFDHADSNAAPGGNGTFEHPFNNLADLQNGSKPGDILYAHGGSIFDGGINPLNQGFTLQDNQRFLGEMPGCPHTVNTQCGVVVIPAVNGGPTPIIDNSNGTSITLANNNEVSGFNITPSGAVSTTTHGIAGYGITNFNINCNTIGLSNVNSDDARPLLAVKPNSPGPPVSDQGDSSIFLYNTSGTGLITTNTLHAESFSGGGGFSLLPGGGPDADAVHIENHGTTALNVTISGNTIMGGAPTVNEGFNSGVFIRTADNAQVTAAITGNNIIKAATRFDPTSGGPSGAITIITGNTSTVTAQISGNTIDHVLDDGIVLHANDTSQLSAQVDGNMVTNSGSNFSDAVLAENFGSGAFMLTLTNNGITGNNGFGVSLDHVAATVSGNTIMGNAEDGLTEFSCTGTFSTNTISNNGALGVFISNGTTVFSGNTVSGNTLNGFFVDASFSMKASIVNNTITNNGLQGGTNAGGIHSEVTNPGFEEDLSIKGNTFSGNTTQAVEVFGAGGSTVVGLRLTANNSDGNYTLDNVTNGTGIFKVEEFGGPTMHSTLQNTGAGTVIYVPNETLFTFVPPNSLPF